MPNLVFSFQKLKMELFMVNQFFLLTVHKV